jgi:toxin ParE1/3/4
MARYKLSPRAKRQMGDIWRHIAVENERAADKLLNRLFHKFELAARHPDIGSARPELGTLARIIVEGRYIAIYEPADYGAEIVAVVHGMREPSSWLE